MQTDKVFRIGQPYWRIGVIPGGEKLDGRFMVSRLTGEMARFDANNTWSGSGHRYSDSGLVDQVSAMSDVSSGTGGSDVGSTIGFISQRGLGVVQMGRERANFYRIADSDILARIPHAFSELHGTFEAVGRQWYAVDSMGRLKQHFGRLGGSESADA